METKTKLLGMIGLARKAGKIVFGCELVCEEIKAKKARLVLIAKDASENTKKRVIGKCDFYSVEYILTDLNTEELAHAIGKSGAVAVISVGDENFSRAITNISADKK